jgi:hypothetical protein
MNTAVIGAFLAQGLLNAAQSAILGFFFHTPFWPVFGILWIMPTTITIVTLMFPGLVRWSNSL